MENLEELIQSLKNGRYDGALRRLYAQDGDKADTKRAVSRAIRTAETLRRRFSPERGCAAVLFSGPGRTEIGGNHTDHQRGRVLCGSVDLDMLACAVPNGRSEVRICSEGFPEICVSLDTLAPVEAEKNTSAALVRGIAAKLTEMGYALSGFDASVMSDVLSGSGLSSSAAYEVLVCNIFNRFFCSDGLDAVTIAKVSQYAERAYFGKPCGLMDQMGSSVGGAVAIDFADPAEPVVERIAYDFNASGCALCILDTGSSHDDLTGEYAAIPQEMGEIAAFFEKDVLREVSENDFLAALPVLRERCGDRAVLRAMHFFEEDRRAAEEARALKTGDFDRFLELVNESGRSSQTLLQNIFAPSAPRAQAVSVALAVGRKLLGGAGAIRVHGGGFAGTVQAFVPNDRLNAFRAGTEDVFGAGKCHVLHVRPQGGCVIEP